MVKISIIVPCYNVEIYLDQCLNSLIHQTLHEIEIICINDGSTDNTLNLLNKFSSIDKRIKIINKCNSGYGDSVNKGIEEAKGEYIGIVEPDDYVDFNMFESLYETATKFKADIVKSNYIRLDEIKNKEKIIKNFRSIKKYNKLLNPSKDKYVFRFTTSNWTGLYSNKNLIKKYNIKHNPSKGASYQDTGFRFLCFSNANSVYYLDKAFYHYRYTNTNSSSNNKGNIYALDEEYNFIKKQLQDYGNYEKLLDVYSMQMFCGFRWNLNRISTDFQQEYINYSANKFNTLIKSQDFDISLFTPIEEYLFNNLIKAPNCFFKKCKILPISVLVRMFFWECKNYSVSFAFFELFKYPIRLFQKFFAKLKR